MTDTFVMSATRYQGDDVQVVYKLRKPSGHIF